MEVYSNVLRKNSVNILDIEKINKIIIIKKYKFKNYEDIHLLIEQE